VVADEAVDEVRIAVALTLHVYERIVAQARDQIRRGCRRRYQLRIVDVLGHDLQLAAHELDPGSAQQRDHEVRPLLRERTERAVGVRHARCHGSNRAQARQRKIAGMAIREGGGRQSPPWRPPLSTSCCPSRRTIENGYARPRAASMSSRTSANRSTVGIAAGDQAEDRCCSASVQAARQRVLPRGASIELGIVADALELRIRAHDELVELGVATLDLGSLLIVLELIDAFGVLGVGAALAGT
jgi:hypothetical protein